ncbi:MAG: diaminopimelate decarboxylase [Planctomycetia bacterium]|nr:diaminopimelate decarboxylase [Planctomycetia bacterium]
MSDHFTFCNRRSEISGIPVKELAQEFGTPLFVYDAASIKQRLADLASFDIVRYAQKACSNIAILKLLRENGAVIDAVSAMEIKRALAAGYSVEPEAEGKPYPIVYTADIFDKEALDLIADEAPVHVNCGSMDMIWQLGERAPGRKITLRINPGFGHGHSQKTNTGGDQAKHGIWFSEVHRCLDLAAHFDLEVVGLHMHIGSGTDLDHLAKVCEAMANVALTNPFDITTISCGGGLPIPYKNGEEYIDLKEYHRLWQTTMDHLESKFGHPIHLEIEPGRYLLAESCCLLSQIRAVKKQGENDFYLVDAGFNDLVRPIMYGAYHPISIASGDDTPLSEKEKDVIIGGPLCESGDIFTQEEGGFVSKRRLPVADVGDYLILEKTGAYGSVMSSNYNSKPFAAEILISEGKPKLIRKRQTFEQLIENEIF